MQNPYYPPGVTAADIDALSPSPAEDEAAGGAIDRAQAVREALTALATALAACEAAGDYCPIEGYDFEDVPRADEVWPDDKISEVAMEQARERAQDERDAHGDWLYDQWRDEQIRDAS